MEEKFRTCAYILIAEERLPYQEGWSKSAEEITVAQILGVVGQLTAAT